MSEITLDQLSHGVSQQFGSVMDELELLRAQIKQVKDTFLRSQVTEIRETVPLMQTASALAGTSYPADRYYALMGMAYSSATLPAWVSVVGTVAYQNWDATGLKAYLQLQTGAALFSQIRFMHYLGVGGQGSSYAPKNAVVSTMHYYVSARFPVNADYATYGIGAINRTGAVQFDTATDHLFQILRNTASWELGTANGTTLSQSSGGTADGNFHEFEVRWTSADLKLYVDGTLTITKSTHMPAQSLMLLMGNNLDDIDVVDVLVEWD